MYFCTFEIALFSNFRALCNILISRIFFLGGSKKYNDSTLTMAKNYVAGIEANYGGTEVYSPINSIFCQPPIPGYTRQIFLLTDGAVSNSQQVIEMVKKNANEGAHPETLQNRLLVYSCNNCDERIPIHGNRYRCLICSDYDLCEPCRNSGAHDLWPHHEMSMIPAISRVSNATLP